MILEINNFFKMGKLKTSENETIHWYTIISWNKKKLKPWEKKTQYTKLMEYGKGSTKREVHNNKYLH